MKIVSRGRLLEMLRHWRGAYEVTLVTRTSPKMLKRNRQNGAPNPFLDKEVTRTAERAVLLGASYEDTVKTQRMLAGHAEPGAFQAGSLWNGAGERVGASSCLVQHRGTGKLYVVFHPKTEGVSQDVWMVDGVEVAEGALAPYMPTKTSKVEAQELENPVAWRTVSLENVSMLKVRGETFVVA